MNDILISSFIDIVFILFDLLAWAFFFYAILKIIEVTFRKFFK